MKKLFIVSTLALAAGFVQADTVKETLHNFL